MNNTINQEILDMSESERQTFSLVNGNITMLSYNDCLKYLSGKYGDYTCPYGLYNSWNLFKTLYITDICRAWDAFYSEYNPIENYNGIESNTHVEKHGVLTRANTGNSSETATANNITSTNSVVPYDSADFKNDNKSVNTGNSTNVINSGSNETETYSDTELNDKTGHIITVDEHERHGNMGVTSTQKMITEEIELRFKPIIIEYLNKFILEYAYYYRGYVSI